MENVDSGMATGLMGTLAGMWVVMAIVCVFLIVVQWKIFAKAGKPGWAAIIPIYNTWVMFEIAWGSGAKMFLSLIPFVGFIFPLICNVKLAKAFGKGTGFGIGIIFLPIIFYPILAFSKDSEYIGPQM